MAKNRRARPTPDFDPADPGFLSWISWQNRQALMRGEQYQKYDDLVLQYLRLQSKTHLSLIEGDTRAREPVGADVRQRPGLRLVWSRPNC